MPGGRACAATEDSAAGKTAAAGVIRVEETADQFPGGMEAGNRAIRAIEDTGAAVHLDATEGEGNTASDGEGEKGRRVEGQRPVALWRCDTGCPHAILDRGVEVSGLDGSVEGRYCFVQCVRIEAEARGKIADRRRFVARDAGRGILILPEKRGSLRVKELPGNCAGLLED